MMEELDRFTFGVVIPAAGKGERMNNATPKIFMELAGQTVLEMVVNVFLSIDFVHEIVIVTQGDYIKKIKEEIIKTVASPSISVIEGGRRRQDSVVKGFEHLSTDDYVIIHDAVRPFVQREDIIRTAEAAVACGGAVLGVMPKSTIKLCDRSGVVKQTLARDLLYEAQTPQVFRRDVFEKGLGIIQEKNIDVTDDARIAEEGGCRVKMVLGNYRNIKITTPEDFIVAQILCGERNYESCRDVTGII